ncbi:MAG: hypothetical protein KAG53_06400 [Endozoicomonadaceae bacterium]|nr:hypothetical protein [Endozoicomonadaceae bacterium]
MSINNNPAPVAPSFALETIQNDVDKALTFLDDKKSVGRNARKIIVCKEIKKFLINNPDVRKGIINDSINFLNKISNKAMKLTILTKILKKILESIQKPKRLKQY